MKATRGQIDLFMPNRTFGFGIIKGVPHIPNPWVGPTFTGGKNDLAYLETLL